MRDTIDLIHEAGIRDCTCSGSMGCLQRLIELVRADERALAAPVQEPVAWTVIGKVTDWSKDFHPYRTQIHQRPAYTTPPAAPAQPAPVPLTDEMRKQMKERCDSMEMRGAFADGWLSAECAHGITEKGQP